MARAIAALVGTPMGGAVYDWKHDYNIVFVISGVMFFIAGAIGFGLHVQQAPLRRTKALQLKEEETRITEDFVNLRHRKESGVDPPLTPLNEAEEALAMFDTANEEKEQEDSTLAKDSESVSKEPEVLGDIAAPVHMENKEENDVTQ